MKTLIVYYSRSGVTRRVAQALAERLGADVEELVDTKNRSGAVGFAVACKDAIMKKAVPIKPPAHNPADYDLVVLGSPVWAKTMSSAMRAYLTEQGLGIKLAAVFCTTHTDGIKNTLDDMEQLLSGEVIARAGFRQKPVKRDEYQADLDAFINEITAKKTDSYQ